MKAVILAAGYGSRLGELGRETPKALLPVGGTPLKRLLDELSGVQEVDDVCVVTNNRFFPAISSWLESNGYEGIALVNDRTDSNEGRLGSLRDLQLVLTGQAIDDDVMVLASDKIFDTPNLGRLAGAYQDGVAVTLYEDKGDREMIRGRHGCLELDSSGFLVGFEEKPDKPKTSLSGLSFYVYPRDSLHLLGKYLDEGNNPDAPGHYLAWYIRQGMKVKGVELAGKCYDLGSLESLERAQRLGL